MDENERNESLEMSASQPEQETEQQTPAASQSSEDIETSFVLGYN